MKCDWLNVCNKEFIKFDDGVYRCPSMNRCGNCGAWTHGSHQGNKMRELKFRRWEILEKDNYNQYKYPGKEGIMRYSGIMNYDGEQLEERQDGDDHGRSSEISIYYSNIGNKNNIMQYTGLKDKNGKEIYESDILTAPYNDLEKYKVCYWSIFRLCHNVGDENISNYASEDIEVMGNIYENPELLRR